MRKEFTYKANFVLSSYFTLMSASNILLIIQFDITIMDFILTFN